MGNYFRLMRMDKPIGALLLLWPTLWALLVASNGFPPAKIVIVFSLGVLLTRSAGCIINDLFDMKFDKHVQRTQRRPLVTGAISRKHALYLFILLCLLAFALAIIFLKPATVRMAIPAVLLMVSYPLMKRFFAVPQAYLGFAYSFGILMVFVELTGALNINAVFLFVANVFWVFGYDTIYALVDMDDDLKIGIKTSAVTFKQYVGLWIAIFYTVFILDLLILGVKLNYSLLYWVCLMYAATLLGYQLFVVVKKKKECYFKMFLLNNWVGLIICVGIVLNYWWQVR